MHNSLSLKRAFRKPAAILATTLACALLSTGTQAADGAALYEQHCAKCHGATGKADTWRGRLVFAQDFSKAAFQSARSDDEILAKINRGPRIMPAYEEKLSLAERNALVKVIRGFAAKQP